MDTSCSAVLRAFVTATGVGLFASASCGCATVTYRATHIARVPPNAPAPVPAKEQLEDDLPHDANLDAVKIYPSETLVGFHYDEAASRLDPVPGSGNTVIGQVRLEFPLMENPGLLLWFTPYRPEESWRKGLCYWQVPLLWVTLGIWTLVPLHYPCTPAPWHTGSLREIAGRETRERILTDGIRAEAKRKGGNAVLMAHVTHTNASGWIVVMGAPTSPPAVAPVNVSLTPAVAPTTLPLAP